VQVPPLELEELDDELLLELEEELLDELELDELELDELLLELEELEELELELLELDELLELELEELEPVASHTPRSVQALVQAQPTPGSYAPPTPPVLHQPPTSQR
jgi:hypothetical protein